MRLHKEKDYKVFISVVISALAFSLSLPNEFLFSGFPLGGFFCLAPYFCALKQTDSPKKGAFLGFIFGMLFHASSSWWLANFRDYAIWTLGATTILFGIFYGFWALLLQYSMQNTICNISGPFLTAIAWTVMEWQKSNGYFAFPWGLLPYTVQKMPVLIQIADISGIYGLSFILALSNAVLTELIWVDPGISPKKMSRWKLPPVRTGLAAVFLLLAWTIGYGTWRIKNPVPIQRKIPLVLVQHNIDQFSNEKEALALAINLSRQGTTAMERQGRKPAMIVWSETLLTRPYGENSASSFYSSISFLEQSSIPVLTGAPLILDAYIPEIANGTILVQRGRIIGSYGKQQLIPFAESIPFVKQKWMRRLMERFIGFSSSWTAGEKAVVMETSSFTFGTPICFEDAFSGICRGFVREGAELLLNLTNDSWSQSYSAELQHMAASRFRTVENRRTLARSANSGITAVIDAEGRIMASLPPFTAGYLAVEVPIQSARQTVYCLLGDWFPLFCALLFTLQMAFRHLRT